MKAAEQLLNKFGGNLAESMGARRGTPAGAGADPGVVPPASSAPDDGRTRAREAGHMEVDRIVPDPGQPRKEFDEEAIGRLAQSIKDRGQLLPIRVRWNQGLGKWVIISGERRYRACLKAGLKAVSCIFLDRDLSPSEVLQEQLIENLVREDLKECEKSRGFRALMDANNWTVTDLAEALHISKASVSRALALLDLPPDVQQQVDQGAIPASAAYEVAKLPDAEAQRELAGRIVSDGMTREETAAAVREQRERSGQAGGAGKKPRTTTRVFKAGAAKVTVTFSKKAAKDEEVLAALEEAAGQARAAVEAKARRAAAA